MLAGARDSRAGLKRPRPSYTFRRTLARTHCVSPGQLLRGLPNAETAMKSSDDNLDRPIWGAAAIAQVLNRTERQAFHLLEAGLLPATKIGQRWASTPRKLLAAVTGDES
jgi:hypothetical protein